MKKKHLTSILILSFALLFASGCGSKLPELSEEENDLVAEYAAGLALENSKNYDDGIATEEEIEKAEKLQERMEKRAEAETQPVSTEEVPQQPVESTAEVEDYVDLATFLELSDFSINFQGYDIFDSYPEDTETGNYISITSQEKSSLLVCKFTVENLTGVEKEINILDKNAIFRISFNSGEQISALPTLLPDDMTTLKDVIGANGSIEVVTVSEVSDDEITDIQTLTMQVKYAGNTGVVKLK